MGKEQCSLGMVIDMLVNLCMTNLMEKELTIILMEQNLKVCGLMVNFKNQIQARRVAHVARRGRKCASRVNRERLGDVSSNFIVHGYTPVACSHEGDIHFLEIHDPKSRLKR